MTDLLLTTEPIEAWEGEGGSTHDGREDSAKTLTGTESQVEWAERIKRSVSAEFDRVAEAFKGVARKQGAQARMDTEAVIEILEAKRAEVMAHTRAGYFIHDWQELRDQVRQMIAHDPRFQAIRARRVSRTTKCN
jgi:hypothetical protein